MIPFLGLPLAQGARAMAQGGLQQLIASSRQVANLSAWQQQGHSQQQQQQQHSQHQQQQQQSLSFAQPLRQFSSSAAAAAEAGAPGSSLLAAAVAGAAPGGLPQRQQQPWQQRQQQQQLTAEEQEIESLLQVLLQPVQNVHKWNAQLSPYLLKVNGHLLYQPSAVLLSALRALHVIRGTLQEDAHVYVVENNKLLRPLIQTAAKSCINPNMWFYHHTWSPGALTNYSSHNRLFKEAHQPNRRLFAAKGYRMVNPLCPEPPSATAPLPRLSWDDKWLLYKKTEKPGYRQLLEELLEAEDRLHKYRPAGSLRGTPKDLRLLVFLDSTRNQVAIKEAYLRNIPTVAIVNSMNEMKYVTYPILARDFHPGFVHFFLDWVLKVANAAPMKAPEIREQFMAVAQKKKQNQGRAGVVDSSAPAPTAAAAAAAAT